MIHFGNNILKKEPGLLYFATKSDYNYCWSNNYNVISKVAVLYNVEIGGIWDGNAWAYKGDSYLFKQLLRKYHNV